MTIVDTDFLIQTIEKREDSLVDKDRVIRIIKNFSVGNFNSVEQEKCVYCKLPFGKDYDVKPCGNGEYGIEAQLHQIEDDAPGIIIMQKGHALGYWDVNYCPMCGKKLNSESDN